MFGNNYFMPYQMNYGMPMAMGLRNASMLPKAGLLSKLGIGSIRGINWSGLLTNTSKTLGVINQAIPVVKQVGPMINNMKSMMRLASAFKNETEPKNKIIKENISKSTNVINENINKENSTVTPTTSLSSPNFFIN